MASSKSCVQLFFSWIDFRMTSAFFGSSQNPGSWVIFSSSAISSSLLSMSKKPPQGFKPLCSFFQVVGIDHYWLLFIVG